MTHEQKKHYSVSGPKGLPFIGLFKEAICTPLELMVRLSHEYGDIIPVTVMGQKVIQLNHPDLIKYVLIENHKNYRKSDAYLRFHSVLGQGLFTSEGEKWKRDRQKIQPMFKREQLEGYYFDVISEVCDKFQARWLALVNAGTPRINITAEMADITLEIITKLVFGRQSINDRIVADIHHAYDVFMDYVKDLRLIPSVDLRKLLHMPAYKRFNTQLQNMRALFRQLMKEARARGKTNEIDMLSLLIEAQQADPQNFTDEDILDQCFTVIFAGFESTSIVMQWMWKVLDERPDVRDNIRAEITQHVPDIQHFTHQDLNKLDYLAAFFHESTRLYPPFWITGRQPLTDDWLGDYPIKKDTLIVIPHFSMHRHPRFWKDPNAFMPERFLPLNEVEYDAGIFFPFSHGPRKCSGNKLAEMEAKMIFAKLTEAFDIIVLNTAMNGFDGVVSLKPKHPLIGEIKRAS